MAGAKGTILEKASLCEKLSGSRDDDTAAKIAKSDFLKALNESFAAKGLEKPFAGKDVFASRSGGYALNTTAIVVA